MNKSPHQKVTIKDIARICHVSTQTISRVINQRPDVSPETREEVERVIAEMGYRPSAVARSLVQQRSFTLGVITAGLKYVGVSQTLNGITEQCEASNYALLIKELPSFTTPNIAPLIESLISHQVEGILYAAPDIQDNIAKVQEELPSYCPPIIFLKGGESQRYTSISIDNCGGARKAVEYFLSKGRRKIGLISGPLEWHEARQRKLGWEEVLKEAGLETSSRTWSEGNWSSSSGEAAFTELVAKYPEMDAVFVSNDQMSLGVLHYANAHGIQVPDDLAVIGFDDLTESAYYSPALTTIHHPLRDLGVLAVKTLLEQIEDNNPRQPIRKITLNTDLVVRQSTP